MKVIKNKTPPFEKSITLSDFYEHPEMHENTKDGNPVIERIELAYSKSTDRFYISGYYAAPNDSYGCDWYISDSGCLSLDDEEIDVLIEQLKILKEVRNKNKGE